MDVSDFAGTLTALDYLLITAIIWLSGVFVWLIKKFVATFEKNIALMTKVDSTLATIDRKIDIQTEHELEIVKTLERIATRQGAQR